jgi:hypothetical protein
MKKIILFLFWAHFGTLSASLGSQLYSQGNLQFNQVLNLIPGSNYTVPAGKVLKIESIATTSGSSVCAPQTNSYFASCGGYPNQNVSNYGSVAYLTLGNLVFTSNGASGICGNASCYNVSVTFPNLAVPIWLNAGKTVSIYNNMSQLLITAIEFNIAP